MTRTFVAFLLLVAVFCHEDTHRCSHDQRKINYDYINIPNTKFDAGSRTLAESYRNLKIHVDYSALSSSTSTTMLNYIQDVLVPPAINLLQAALTLSPELEKFFVRIFFGASSLKNIIDFFL